MRSSVNERAKGRARCLALLLAFSHVAHAADHCAPPPLAHTEALGIDLGVRFEHAQYSTETYAGNYSGAMLAAALLRPSWDVSLDVPVYHLLKNGLDVAGPGDPYLGGRLQVLASRAETVALGLGLGLSLPLGDAEQDLGMGHFMLHPGLWLRTSQGDLRSEWTVGYGRVLGGPVDGHGTGPLVSPMNASELSVGGALSLRSWRVLELRAAGMLAAPLPATSGEARATLGLSAGLLLGKVAVTSGFSLPVLGDPYDAKLDVAVSYAF